MNIYQNWFLASRPWSFTMTAISISVGGALAAIDGIAGFKFLAGCMILKELPNPFFDL